MSGVDAPPGCPKCGDRHGFRDSKPVYRHEDDLAMTEWSGPREWLEFSCTRCGYTVRRDVADAHQKSAR